MKIWDKKKDKHKEQVFPKEIDGIPVIGGGKPVGVLSPIPTGLGEYITWIPETDKALKKSNAFLRRITITQAAFTMVLLVVAMFAVQPLQFICVIMGFFTIGIFALELLIMLGKEEKRVLGKDLPDLSEPLQLGAPNYLPDGGLTMHDEETDQELPAHEFWELQDKRREEKAEKRYVTCYGNYCNILTKFDREMSRKCLHDCPINTECMTVTTIRLQNKMFKKLGHGESWKGENEDDD